MQQINFGKNATYQTHCNFQKETQLPLHFDLIRWKKSFFFDAVKKNMPAVSTKKAALKTQFIGADDAGTVS